MLGSKAAVGHCILPTGFVIDDKVIQEIHFRELAGPEEDVFANKKMSVSRKFTTIMQNCTKKIGDIEDRQKINNIIPKMVETDRIYYLIQLRMLSIDPVLKFKSTCPACEHEDTVLFDLDGVGIKNPPVATSLFSEVELSTGDVVRIRVADAKAEEIIEKATDDKNAISLAMMARVESFNNHPASLANVRDLNLRDRKKLRDAIDKLEGEVDDEFEATCPACAHTYKGSIPLAGTDFLAF